MITEGDYKLLFLLFEYICELLIFNLVQRTILRRSKP